MQRITLAYVQRMRKTERVIYCSGSDSVRKKVRSCMKHMTHMTQIPHIENEMLTYQHDGQTRNLLVGTQAWFTWLQTATTFTYTIDGETFTARRDRAGNKRGGWYWRASHQRDGKLHRVYLGTSEELTLEHLQAVAHTFTEHMRRSDIQIERSSPTLPVPLTSLIGREREVTDALVLLLRPDVRLLTLVGVGGVGKTHLALQLAHEAQAHFPDGVSFISLAALREGDLVLPTIAQSLGLHVSSIRNPLQGLQAALRACRMLLVIDNFEQIVEAAPFLIDLLVACPGLTLLVTSRETLHMRGEHTFAVLPLPVPASNQVRDAETLLHYGASALFLERARELHPPLHLTPDNASRIAEVCRRLDGLPLAIELAVARLAVLPLPSLLERLEHRLDVLTCGPRDLPTRQSTLRQTIAWSYDLLSTEEQRLFRLCAVFVRDATVEALEAVYWRAGGERASFLNEVASLVDKHLLYRSGQEHSRSRLFMLETIREYGLERLTAHGELETARLAHASYYLTLAEEMDTHPFTTGEGEERWFEQGEQEHDNVRAALEWSVEQGEDRQRREIAWRFVAALQWFWVNNGYIPEGQQFVERVLSRDEGIAPSIRAKALHGAGWLALWQGEYERAERLCRESLHLYRELHDQRGMALVLHRLARIASSRGDAPAAISLYEASLVISRAIGDRVQQGLSQAALALTSLRFSDHTVYPRIRSLLEESLTLLKAEHYQGGIAWSLYGLGLWHFQQAEVDAAHSLFEESLALFRASGQRQYIAYLLLFLGKASARQGDLSTAYALHRESLNQFEQLDDHRSIGVCLQGWADVVARQGAFTWAAQLWGAAHNFREQTESRASVFSLFTIPGEDAEDERLRAIVRTQLGEQNFVQALNEGRAMIPAQALSAQEQMILAYQAPTTSIIPDETDQQQTHSSSLLDTLTEREREVLRLVAQGLSDAQVANILVISPRTVNAHLRSIYSKLNVTSRHAATMFALEHHLIQFHAVK